ncbi:MAG TPA: HAD family phosphatase [Solirubrobacteraceae bacterium]|nr:HAD family phosphatase [Solirubrobacteraceae bacterium]
MSRIQAVISDFGGVLTSPLMNSFAAFQESSGVSLEALGKALGTLATARGTNPLFELETGRMSEAEFLGGLSRQLTADLGRPVEMRGFTETYLAALDPNQPMIDYMRGLRERRYKMAICTNNIREWERLWRAKFPVEEIFEVIVDSSRVGSRKPERRIYEITLERLEVDADAALFVDDVELNCEAARELGMTAVWFRDNAQAMAEIASVLDA